VISGIILCITCIWREILPPSLPVSDGIFSEITISRRELGDLRLAVG
jgi:hypothetical protein